MTDIEVGGLVFALFRHVDRRAKDVDEEYGPIEHARDILAMLGICLYEGRTGELYEFLRPFEAALKRRAEAQDAEQRLRRTIRPGQVWKAADGKLYIQPHGRRKRAGPGKKGKEVGG